MKYKLTPEERVIVQQCIDVARACAQEFREHASKASTSLNRALNELATMNCELVATRIQEKYSDRW
jgi:hypothetical protein